jgi:predicted nucleic acid-binding protein
MVRFVLDATGWINFARAESIDLLGRGLSGRLVVGMIVRQREVKTWPRHTARAGQAFSFDQLVAHGWVECVEMASAELARFDEVKSQKGVQRLGAGETEAFILASGRRWTLCTDDGPARKILGALPGAPPISGTIGLLRALLAAGAVRRDEAAALLRLMREQAAASLTRGSRSMRAS